MSLAPIPFRHEWKIENFHSLCSHFFSKDDHSLPFINTTVYLKKNAYQLMAKLYYEKASQNISFQFQKCGTLKGTARWSEVIVDMTVSFMNSNRGKVHSKEVHIPLGTITQSLDFVSKDFVLDPSIDLISNGEIKLFFEGWIEQTRYALRRRTEDHGTYVEPINNAKITKDLFNFRDPATCTFAQKWTLNNFGEYLVEDEDAGLRAYVKLPDFQDHMSNLKLSLWLTKTLIMAKPSDELHLNITVTNMNKHKLAPIKLSYAVNETWKTGRFAEIIEPGNEKSRLRTLIKIQDLLREQNRILSEDKLTIVVQITTIFNEEILNFNRNTIWNYLNTMEWTKMPEILDSEALKVDTVEAITDPDKYDTPKIYEIVQPKTIQPKPQALTQALPSSSSNSLIETLISQGSSQSSGLMANVTIVHNTISNVQLSNVIMNSDTTSTMGDVNMSAQVQENAVSEEQIVKALDGSFGVIQKKLGDIEQMLK